MRFRKGNKIPYGQDMAFWRGVPHGVDFEIERVLSDGLIFLCAPGYGKKSNYGNGSICISLGNIRHKHYSVWKRLQALVKERMQFPKPMT